MNMYMYIYIYTYIYRHTHTIYYILEHIPEAKFILLFEAPI